MKSKGSMCREGKSRLEKERDWEERKKIRGIESRQGRERDIVGIIGHRFIATKRDECFQFLRKKRKRYWESFYKKQKNPSEILCKRQSFGKSFLYVLGFIFGQELFKADISVSCCCYYSCCSSGYFCSLLVFCCYGCC